MGFISFNEKYYRRKLETLEKGSLSEKDIYEAQQLLKVLDDLADEGYTELNCRMEKDFACLTRLRLLLEKGNVSPIPVEYDRFADIPYRPEEYELNDFLTGLIADADRTEKASDGRFLTNIYEYSQWIGYEDGTAYIFLLRDAMLPYVYYKCRHSKGLYPWLIGRKFIEDITGVKNADDGVRQPIYEALEAGRSDFEAFFIDFTAPLGCNRRTGGANVCI